MLIPHCLRRASKSRLMSDVSLIMTVTIVTMTALAIYFAPSVMYPLLYVRWIIGAIFILILPGYVLADTFFIENGKANLFHKFMLSCAFSVIIVGVIGYTLNRLPWGINTSTVFVSLSLVSLIFVVIKIILKKNQKTHFHHGQTFALVQGLRMPHFAVLTSIVALSIIVKAIPYMRIDAFLDLDPSNHLMKVNAILNAGRVPSFDSLSLAPQGTSATYTITPLGFEFLVVALELVTQAPLIKLMGLLPAFYGAFTILAMFFLCFETTRSINASLFAAFFTAFSTSWLLIYGVTMNPLAENVGLFLFPLTLLYMARYIRTGQKFNILCSGILFGAMFYVHLFTVFYFVLTLVGYAVFSFLINEKTKFTLKTIICILALGLFLSLPVLFQIVPVSVQLGNVFSRTALELAFASDTYLALLPQDLPRILSFPLSYIAIIALWLTIATIAVRIAYRVLGKNFKGYKSHILSASWCLSLLFAGFVHLVEPLRDFLAVTPFSGPFLYAHRVIPYLTLAFYLLTAVAIDRYIFPLMRVSNSTFKFKSKAKRPNVLIILAITVLITAPISMVSVAYTYELTSWPTAQAYKSFFAWVKENTGTDDVFIANNWDMAMWLRAIGKRPTVFSHVHQDLVSSDAEKRMRLHAVVFSDYDNFYDEAVQLLNEYTVSYVVVTSKVTYVDIINKRWVWEIPNLEGYIDEMDSRGYLTKVFFGDNIWVYSVNKNTTLYSYRFNGANKRNFIGNGWTAPYYLNGMCSRNATRGFIAQEWRFSDFWISIDPKRKEYFLEVSYYDTNSANSVDLFTYTQEGPVKIGSLLLNGTHTFRKATFTLLKDSFYDYYNEIGGFQQYFIIGDLPFFNLPISNIIIQET